MGRFSYAFIVNKRVKITLDNGTSYEGMVKQAFDNHIIIEQEKGKLILSDTNINTIAILG